MRYAMKLTPFIVETRYGPRPLGRPAGAWEREPDYVSWIENDRTWCRLVRDAQAGFWHAEVWLQGRAWADMPSARPSSIQRVNLRGVWFTVFRFHAGHIGLGDMLPWVRTSTAAAHTGECSLQYRDLSFMQDSCAELLEHLRPKPMGG
jgi:hypothetical protein